MRDGMDRDDCGGNTVSGSVRPRVFERRLPAISRWPTISTWIWLGHLHTVLSNDHLASRSGAERRECPNAVVCLIAKLPELAETGGSDSDASLCE